MGKGDKGPLPSRDLHMPLDEAPLIRTRRSDWSLRVRPLQTVAAPRFHKLKGIVAEIGRS